MKLNGVLANLVGGVTEKNYMMHGILMRTKIKFHSKTSIHWVFETPFVTNKLLTGYEPYPLSHYC